MREACIEEMPCAVDNDWPMGGAEDLPCAAARHAPFATSDLYRGLGDYETNGTAA